MPRYYFHVTDGQDDILIEEEEGEAFDHAAEAQQNARLVALELEDSTLGGRSITVTDEHGAVVIKLPI